jgi:hypothetical protein
MSAPVGIPLLFGLGERIKRNGKTFEARCGACKRVVKMYEGVRHTNVSAFEVVSLWDDEEPVVQCGECLGVYGEDAAQKLRRPSVGRRDVPAARKPIDDAAIDAELAALKKRLGK